MTESEPAMQRRGAAIEIKGLRKEYGSGPHRLVALDDIVRRYCGNVRGDIIDGGTCYGRSELVSTAATRDLRCRLHYFDLLPMQRDWANGYMPLPAE